MQIQNATQLWWMYKGDISFRHTRLSHTFHFCIIPSENSSFLLLTRYRNITLKLRSHPGYYFHMLPTA